MNRFCRTYRLTVVRADADVVSIFRLEVEDCRALQFIVSCPADLEGGVVRTGYCAREGIGIHIAHVGVSGSQRADGRIGGHIFVHTVVREHNVRGKEVLVFIRADVAVDAYRTGYAELFEVVHRRGWRSRRCSSESGYRPTDCKYRRCRGGLCR